MEENREFTEVEEKSDAPEMQDNVDVGTSDTENGIILRVVDLKKHFLTKKEWKFVKEPVTEQNDGDGENSVIEHAVQDGTPVADNGGNVGGELVEPEVTPDNGATPAQKFKRKLIRKKTRSEEHTSELQSPA